MKNPGPVHHPGVVYVNPPQVYTGPAYADFNVQITHSYECFADIAKGVADSLRELGYTVSETRGTAKGPGRTVVFAANMSSLFPGETIAKDAIIFQLEQYGPRWMTGNYLAMLKTHVVWDFSEHNVAKLKEAGCPRVHLCRIGYRPKTVQAIETTKDIDVLFLGSMNHRRLHILNSLRANGVKVHDTPAWGDERTRLIARAKVVLNVHYYDYSVLEMVRLGPMIEQGAFIVSEQGADRDMDLAMNGGIVFAHYDHVIQTVLDYLGRPSERDRLASAAVEKFRAMSQKSEVERCLDEMGHPKATQRGPVKCFIINRDRLTWPKAMVEQIRRLKGEPIIVDNGSTYPPLLEWYKTSDCHVIRLGDAGQNATKFSPWKCGVIAREVPSNGLYVVTDPDLDLSSVPDDALSVLERGLSYGVTKAGLSLELNDVPRHCLSLKQVNGRTLEQCEIGYWHVRLDPQFWRAATDTTFALYRNTGPMNFGPPFYTAVRADRPYTARHLPWYRLPKDYDDEDKFYVAHRYSNASWYDSL